MTKRVVELLWLLKKKTNKLNKVKSLLIQLSLGQRYFVLPYLERNYIQKDKEFVPSESPTKVIVDEM